MADLVSAIVTRYFSSSNNELCIQELPVDTIVKKYGTPLFIYDSHVVDCKWNLLRSTLPSKFSIYYSVKANPNPILLKYLLTKGCGLEIASGGEFYLALEAGCLTKRILFAGPGKTEDELELVLSHNIGEIHVESLLEAERISSISRRLDIKAKIAVRVNPCGETEGGALRMGGRSAPFGVDEEILDDVVEKLSTDEFLEFSGIHLFLGTQILDHTVLLNQYRKGLEIARRIASRIECPLQTLDFGGGFGIPYFPNEQELNMGKLGENLTNLINEIKGEKLFEGTQFIIEPGRYLVGEAGIYVTRINDIKISRGKKFLIVDGGMNHHLAASGNLGQVIKRNFPIALLNKLKDEPKEKVDIVGPLCTPLDVLAREVYLPFADVGDLVGVFQSGAYARTASPLGFLSHPTPAEVLIQDGNVGLMRRRGTYDDLLIDIP